MSKKKTIPFSMILFGDEWTDLWRRRQQLAFRLAMFKEVENIIYVEQPLTLTSLLKYILRKGTHGARISWSRIFRSKSLIYKINEKCYVITPLTVLPWINFKFIVYLNNSLCIRFQIYLIKHLIGKLKIDNLVVWVGVPFIPLELLHQFKQTLTWYDYTEDYSAYSFMKASFCESVKYNNEYLFRHADIVSVVNQGVYFNQKGKRDEIHLIPNAVDIELYSRPLSDEPPEDLKNIKGPKLGFVGGINPILNLELIEYLAQLRPQWSIVLIGNVSLPNTILSRLQRYPSIHFLGVKPYYILPYYIHYFDVCFNSYNQDYDCNPQKNFLYLATSKPVVELKPKDYKDVYNSLVRVASSKEEFITIIEDVLENDSQELRRKRIEWARENSWEVRARQIVDVIIRRLKNAR